MKPLSTMMKAWLVTAMCVAIGLSGLLAATPNPTSGSAGYFMMPHHFDSQLTSSVTSKVAFKMPWPAELVDVKCAGRAFSSSGSPTFTWTIKAAGSSIATCAPTTASTEVTGTVTTSAIADEALITIDYTSTGSTPTADDMDLILIFKRQ